MAWKILSAVTISVFLTATSFADVDKNTPGVEENASSVESLSTPKDSKDQGHHAPYLLVSCMDFRLRKEVAEFMKVRAGTDTYDEFVIPGASLGAFNENYPHWVKTFEDTVGLCIKLHSITHVIFLDHRNCGFYKMLKGEHCCDDKDAETHVHATQFEAVRKIMKEKFPDLKVETLIMGLDGQVEEVQPETGQS